MQQTLRMAVLLATVFAHSFTSAITIEYVDATADAFPEEIRAIIL